MSSPGTWGPQMRASMVAVIAGGVLTVHTPVMNANINLRINAVINSIRPPRRSSGRRSCSLGRETGFKP